MSGFRWIRRCAAHDGSPRHWGLLARCGRAGGGPHGAFVDEIRSNREFPILAASGELRYDKRDGIYQAGTPEKMMQPSLPGTLIELKAGQCAVTGSGPVVLPVDYGMVTQRSAGSIKAFPTGTGIETSLSVGIDFPFDDAVWKLLAERMQQWPTALPLDITQTTFEASLREWLGLEGADEVLGGMTLMGVFKKTPASIQHRLLLTGLTSRGMRARTLQWGKRHRHRRWTRSPCSAGCPAASNGAWRGPVEF